MDSLRACEIDLARNHRCFVLSSIKRVLQGRLDGLDLAPLCADILRMEI